MVRLLKFIAIAALCLVALFYALLRFALHNPHPPLALSTGTLVIRDATVYPSPDDPALTHATVLIRDGRIAAVGQSIDIPADATTIPCNACVVTAGFWNNHVHFTESKWMLSAFKSSATLNAQLADMLTSRGFTTVVDVGSNPLDTVSLRRRIETDGLLGPYIYTAGAALYPPHALPYYLRNTQPMFLQKLSPQPETPAQAEAAVQNNIDRGSDVLKLFTGSYVERGKVQPMPVDIATAAANVAHAHGQLVFAHPSNLAGVLVARDAGVNVLAHAADSTNGVTPQVLQSIVDHHMTMVPTLKMFGTTVTKKPTFLDPIFAEVNTFHSLGGNLIFGTDVGYMTDYTTQDEFTYLQRSGLNPMDILRMLTTAPAKLFGVESQKGRITPGSLADLVILGSDPANDPTAFANVQTTIRSGRIIYQKP